MLNKLRYILKKEQFRTMEKNDIDMEQLKKMVNSKAILVDVRSPQEYEEGHLDGSILIPEYELKIDAEKILINKEAVIIVYCSSGTRSKKAQHILTQMGYMNVYNLYQGLERYL